MKAFSYRPGAANASDPRPLGVSRLRLGGRLGRRGPGEASNTERKGRGGGAIFGRGEYEREAEEAEEEVTAGRGRGSYRDDRADRIGASKAGREPMGGVTMTCGGIILGVVAALAAEPGAGAGDGPKVGDVRLEIRRFAADPDIVTPTGLTVDRQGRVLVIESHTHFRPEGYKGPKADRIRLLEDLDGDGKAEKVSTFFEGTAFTMSLAFHPEGALYVATRYEVFLLRDLDGDGKADGPRETLVTLKTAGNYPHNGLAGFAFDDKGRVYFGLGENLGADYQLVGRDGTTLTGGGEGGNVYRCDPDGSKLEKQATGFWNPFHQAFDTFGRLFLVDNDPDSRPPCRLVHVVPGGDYGYRFRNGRKGLHPFTAWNGELPGTLPMAAGTGEAPSGVLVYESDNLPEEYRGDLFTTSWGDHRVERFRLQPRGASFKGTAQPFVTGGEDFRPVAIAAAPDGSIYLSDWVDKSYNLHGKGRVWRLRAINPPKRVEPKDDAAALGHPDRPTREAAASRLARTPRGRETLRHEAASHADPRGRAASLSALSRSAEVCDEPTVRAATRDRSDDVRALAVRHLPPGAASIARVAADDPSPLVRAEALRRFTSADEVKVLLNVLNDPDPFLTQAAREGLKASRGPDLLVGLVESDDPARRLHGLLALRDVGGSSARRVLAKALTDPDPSVRFVAIEWVGDDRLEPYRGALKNGLASGSITRPLFEAYLAALGRLDGKARDSRDEQAGEGYVVALLVDPKTPSAVLRRALRVLRPDHPALGLGRLNGFLSSPDPGLRLEAVRALRDGALPERFDALARLAADESRPSALRAEAVVGLSADTESRRALLMNLAAGNIRSLRHEALRSLRGVTPTAAETARAASFRAADPETAALLALWNGSRTAPKMLADEPLAAWLARLAGPADPAEGERVFFHPRGPGCYRCHQIDGRGGRAGPDLSTTSAALTRERLVESIVNPSKEVAPQYVTWLVARKNGEVFTGILLDESATGAQTYADAQGRRITVEAGDLEDRRPQSTSIMPADLSRLMTTGEFRDLLAFLREKAVNR